LAASNASAGGISFSPLRYAFRCGRTFPSLHAEGPVDQNILDTARYFVTLHLGPCNTELVVDDPAPQRVVLQEMAEEASPLLRRLDPAARKYLFRGRAPRVKRPVVVTGDAPRPQNLRERRRSDEHPLVAMRVLRPKSRIQ
jgi:hypothetical protein